MKPRGKRGRRTLERLQLDDVRFTLEEYKCYKVHRRADGTAWVCSCMTANTWHGPAVYAHDSRTRDRWIPGKGAPLRRWYCSGWEWQDVLEAARSADPLARAIEARVLGKKRRTRKIGT